MLVTMEISNDSEGTLSPQGNPQGKGLALIIERLAGLAPRAVQSKPINQILVEYWQSTLVLSANFAFRIVAGRTYFLYHSDRWQLSLIGPDEWRGRAPGVFVGRCRLKVDATWQIDFVDELLAHQSVVDALETFIEGFEYRINGAETLADALPDYEPGLPYQQRMMATALTASLRHSAQLSGSVMLAPKLGRPDWQALLPVSQADTSKSVN